MRTVWVVQEPAQVPRVNSPGTRPVIDISSAQRFGTLRYLFEWSELKDMSPENIGPVVAQRMRDFKYKDYILMIGNPTAMALAGMVASRKTSLFRLLYWDRKIRDYIIAWIKVDELIREMERYDVKRIIASERTSKHADQTGG